MQIADYGFWEELIEKGKISDDAETSPSGSPLLGPESNVYNFGVLLLEIISGKLPYDEKEGSLVNWVTNLVFFLFLFYVYPTGYVCQAFMYANSNLHGLACMHAFAY